MLERPVQPAVILIVSILTPSRFAADVEACLVLWALKIEISIPLSFKVAFIQRLNDWEHTLLKGFQKLINRETQSALRFSAEADKYHSKTRAGHTDGLLLKNGRFKDVWAGFTPDVLIGSVICMINLSSNLIMLQSLINEKVCTRCAVTKAKRVINFFDKRSKERFSLGYQLAK